jgi:hypothetical protein
MSWRHLKRQPDEDCAKDEQAGIDSRREPLRNLWDD